MNSINNLNEVDLEDDIPFSDLDADNFVSECSIPEYILSKLSDYC